MELDASFSEAPVEMQDSCRHAVGPTDANDVPESLATAAAKNILNSGDVLEVSCWNCDAPSSEASSELKTTLIPDCETFGFQNSEITEGMKQSMFTNSQGFGKYNGYPRTEIQGHRRFPGETADSAIKKESLFELRAFQEERKPSKLFDCMSDKEQVHVKKIRPSEEIAELERERLELIKGQAVKKNPGIAAKWWNPPQEKTLEEELDPDQLESHRKYEERKQKKLEAPCLPQMLHDHLRSPVAAADPSKEDVVVEQIDFSAARNQFLQMENNKAPRGARRGVTPKMYSAKPFSRSPNNTDVERPNSLTADGFITQDTSEGVTVNTMGVDCRLGSFLEKQSENGTAECEMKDNIQTWVDDGDFTHARAVMAILGDDDAENSSDPYSSEEVRCGIGEISLKPRGLTTEETRSSDVNHDSGNDSGASSVRVLLHPPLEDDSSFPSHRIHPVNNQVDKSENELSTSDTDHSGILTEEQLEYHAGLLVQNAIQQAIAQQRVQREPSPGPEQTATYPEQHAEAVVRSHSPLREEDKRDLWPLPSHECGRNISIPDASSFAPADTNTFAHGEPPGLSPTESSKQEFSYFSKYSEAAELRSTASVARSQDTEVSSGPFRLRSRKQRTLSMIEEEIRAAQEREEELKRQRQTQTLGRGQRQSPGSQPSRLTVTGKTGTAPGTIEKMRIVPPANSPSEGPLPSPLSDAGSDDSGGGQRPKNFMQTLMEDYESHKVKRREQAEDASVLEATRVTRRKSNMAVRWEAGLYANQDEAEAEAEEA